MTSVSRGLKNEFWYLMFVLPGICLFALALVIPLGMGVGYSFTDWDGVSDKFNTVGLANFAQALSDGDLWRALGNTFVYAAILTLLVNMFALALALGLDTYLKFRNTLRTIFFVPGVISVVLAAFIWNYNYAFGVAHLLEAFGISDYTSPLGNPNFAMAGLIVVAVWQGLGAPMIIFIAGLQGIPQELVEASRIDGASPWRTLLSVKLPMLAPAITVNMVLTLTGALKVFDLVFVTTNGGPGFATEVMSTYIYRNSFAIFKGGYGTALSMIFFAVLLIVTVLQLSIFRKREIDL